VYRELKPQKIILKEPFTFNLDKAISLRLYPDSHPRNLEIADLQKGLVLMRNDEELIEEGAGFGVPIVKFSGQTFFSSTAEVFLRQRAEGRVVLEKIFLLDTVSKKQICGAYLNDDFYSFFHKTFEKGYLGNGRFRRVFDQIMLLRNALGVQTKFIKVLPRGRVSVVYIWVADLIKVHVTFFLFDRTDCKELMLLNEQGAAYFRKFVDTDGTILSDSRISAWEEIKAKQAFFFDDKARLSFSLRNLDGAVLYRGREQIKDRFSWAGMTYILPAETLSFDYTVRIMRDR
jgi:hypothetical protein